MARRSRVPGPVVQDQTLGNTSQRQENGLSRWQSIDLEDGSWTKYDPNAHIKSVSSGTDGNRISVYAAKSNLRWTNNDQTAGRWYSKLIGPDGNALTFNDFFSVEFIIQLQTVHANNASSPDKHGCFVGLVDSDVTDTTSGCNWAGMGTSLNTMSSGSAGFKVFAGGDTVYGNSSNSSCTKIYGHVSPPIVDQVTSTDPSTRILYAMLLDASDNELLASYIPSIQTFEYTGTDPVYLFVAPFHTTNNTGMDDMDATWKLWYRVNLSRDGLGPTFVPGGGSSG